MKKLILIFALLFFELCLSQDFIDENIFCAKFSTDQILKNKVGGKVFNSNFKFEKSKTILEVYNENIEKLERVNLNDFKSSNFQVVRFWVVYDIYSKDDVLTSLQIPFYLNCTTPWGSKSISKILKPYLKVLNKKVKINLREALNISETNGLKNIYYWDIDFEKRKLVWTIKSKLENNSSDVLKLNARTGKIMKKYIEIPID